jgi:Retrotransposon gag protein
MVGSLPSVHDSRGEQRSNQDDDEEQREGDETHVNNNGLPRDYNVPQNSQGTSASHREIKREAKAVNKEEKERVEREAVGRSNVGGLLPLVPYFSGEINTTTVQDFIRALKSASKLGNWTDDMLATVLKQRLIGQASDYLNSNPEFEHQSWDQLRESFLSWFGQTPSGEDPLQTFYQCTQRPSETAKLYLTRLKLAGVAVSAPISDSHSESGDAEYILTKNLVSKALVRTFLKGLREESGGSIVSLHHPQTIDDALALAEEFEYQRRNKTRVRTLQSMGEPVLPPPQEKASLTSQPPQVQIQRNKPKQNFQSNTQNSNGGRARTSVTCFNCQGQGHYSDTCSSPKNMGAMPNKFVASNQGQNKNSQDARNQNQENRFRGTNISCSYCHYMGHTIDICRIRAANIPICSYCNKAGHTADVCRLRTANNVMQRSFSPTPQSYSQAVQGQNYSSNSSGQNAETQTNQAQSSNSQRNSQQNFGNSSR